MGIAAAVTAVVASVLPETLAFAAPEIAGALMGAGGGALFGEVTGGDPGMGALGGAITGGFIPAGGALGAAGGIGSTAGDILGGVAGGALGSGVTGGNPLIGAAEGGVAGGIAGLTSGSPGTTSTPGTPTTAGAGASGSGAGGGLGASLSSLSGGGADAAGTALLGASTPDALSAAIGATPPPAVGTPGLGGTVTPTQMSSLLNPTSPGIAPSTPPAPTGGGGINPGSLQGGGNVPSLGLGGGIDPGSLQGGGNIPSLGFGAESASPSLMGASSPGGLLTAINATAPPASLPTAAPSAALSPLGSAALTANNLGAGNLGGAGTPTFSAGGGNILDSITSFAKNHPLVTTGASLLGSQLLSPVLQKVGGANTLSPAEQQLLNSEQPGISAANSLVGSLQSGQLPPGADTAVNQALQADIANIKSRYASMGMSGSSAEQQDIANAQNQAAAQKFQLAQAATKTGLDALGLNQSVYETLVRDQLSKQTNLSNAISNFFGSIGTGTALGEALNNKAA